MAHFEVFVRTELRGQGPDPQVTITARSVMALNLAAYEALGSPSAVEYLFDRELNMIGIRPADPNASNAYRVKKSGHTYRASALAFTTHYSIDTPEGRRRAATVQDGVLCIDLNQPGQKITSNRTGK